MYLDTLEVLEVVKGKEKETLLAGCLWDKELAQVLDATYNFNRKYFIKQLPKLDDPSPCIGGHLPEFMALLVSLETRAVTGDAAKLKVQELFNRCTFLERKWFQRILLKDLRCGMGVSTCRKAGFPIPEFEVMLAKDGKECKKLDAIIKKGVWVSKKFDGYRCLAVVKNGVATLYSRNGVEYENFPSVQAALVKVCDYPPGRTFVFDGEIMSDDFQSMQKSAFASKRGTTVGDVKYHIFDMIPVDEWVAQKFVTPASDRFKALGQFFHQLEVAQKEVFPLQLPIDRLVYVEHQWVNDLPTILKLEQQFLSEGYEGAMVLPDIAYYLGRKTNAMMKFKTMLSMDCKVIGTYEGTGKYAGSLGGLNVIQEDGKTACSVGSGFDDAERSKIYADPVSVLARTVEIRYQNLSDDGVMRFPIFIRFRDLGPNSGKI